MQETVLFENFIEQNLEKKAFENFRGRFWPEGDLEFFWFDNESKGGSWEYFVAGFDFEAVARLGVVAERGFC